MNALALEPKVISLANTLGVSGGDAVTAIRDYCIKRIQTLTRSARSSLRTIGDLQRVLCEKLNLTIHEVWSDAELGQIVGSYVARGEMVFAYLQCDLDANTYGVLIRLNQRVGKQYAWVAVVDCRGEKRHRRFFTAWHEIVHCITAADQYELPFRRTIIGRKPSDPLERLTDVIAGDVAFFDPIFRPHLDAEAARDANLTFETVERIRDRFCPEASFESTLNACVARYTQPALFLKAGMILKSAEQAALDSPQKEFFKAPAPRPQLRVINTIRNEAARKIGLHIPPHFRIPGSSVITDTFRAGSGTTTHSLAPESLATWMTSGGKKLPALKVNVVARKIGEEVFALLSTQPYACRT
ncbi:MAG TPA: hypothetical protein VK993_04220 [Chthoniobacterales bacterium]|nr:hypothetical protein [Chthoniobacterales bacterium]